MVDNRSDAFVSVVMVVKNDERFLPFAVESVMEQKYEPLEIIVVDGQSTDRTAEIAKAIEGVHYIYQPDRGLANARNCAIQAARGKFIAFLDSDDVWARNKLSTQLGYLAAHPECEGTVTRLRYVLEPEYDVHHRAKQKHYEHDQIGYTPSALVARMDLFRKVGLFDPAYFPGCDADWFARLLDSRLPIAVIPELLLYKRIHDSNLSLDIVQSRKEALLFLRKSLHRKRKNSRKV
jgi:glycosyltransferase involved in cell wall biosynthesis